jgi:hypothetical protein
VSVRSVSNDGTAFTFSDKGSNFIALADFRCTGEVSEGLFSSGRMCCGVAGGSFCLAHPASSNFLPFSAL